MSKPVGPYTPILQRGNWLVSSGQLGLKEGLLVEGIASQTIQALKNLEALLLENSSGLHELVKVTVFLTSMQDFDEMNKAYISVLRDNRPTRSAIGVCALPLGACVEIEGWAWHEQGN